MVEVIVVGQARVNESPPALVTAAVGEAEVGAGIAGVESAAGGDTVSGGRFVASDGSPDGRDPDCKGPPGCELEQLPGTVTVWL